MDVTTAKAPNASTTVSGRSITFSSGNPARGLLRVFATSNPNAYYILDQPIRTGTSGLPTSKLPTDTQLEACVSQPPAGGYDPTKACSPPFTISSGGQNTGTGHRPIHLGARDRQTTRGQDQRAPGRTAPMLPLPPLSRPLPPRALPQMRAYHDLPARAARTLPPHRNWAAHPRHALRHSQVKQPPASARMLGRATPQRVCTRRYSRDHDKVLARRSPPREKDTALGSPRQEAAPGPTTQRPNVHIAHSDDRHAIVRKRTGEAEPADCSLGADLKRGGTTARPGRLGRMIGLRAMSEADLPQVRVRVLEPHVSRWWLADSTADGDREVPCADRGHQRPAAGSHRADRHARRRAETPSPELRRGCRPRRDSPRVPPRARRGTACARRRSGR